MIRSGLKMEIKIKVEKYIFAMYCAGVIIQNVLATKNISVFIFSVTTGILVSPLVFLTQDIYTETYGFKKARNMVLFGYLMNFCMIILGVISIYIPKASFYQNQEAFATIMGTTFRIVVSSFIAYSVGSVVNVKIMADLKERSSLFFRAISSTVVGQLLDNFLFSFLAFIGIMKFKDVLLMTVGATIIETLYEVVLFPLTKRCINKLNS